MSNKKFDKINIGSNKRNTNLEIVEAIFKIMKKKNLTNLNKKNYIKFVKDRPGHDDRYALNTDFFKKNIKYKIQKNLMTGLEETVNWYINNKNWLKTINKTYKYKRLGLVD